MAETTATDRLAEIKAWLANSRAPKSYPSTGPTRNVLFDEWTDWLIGQAEQVDWLVSQLNQLRAHVATLEWAAVPEPTGTTVRCCPVCGAIADGLHRGGSHAPDCWLAEAIGGERDA
jgi:hypothetical protein